MKKAIIIILLVCIAVFSIILSVRWFWGEKYEIEHVERVGMTAEYTYTKKSQIEEVLNNNKLILEELVLGMQNSNVYVLYLDQIDKYIEQNNIYVKENELLLRTFYKKTKMDKINITGYRAYVISQSIHENKAVNLRLIGTIDENNKFTWRIANSAQSGYLSLRIYNLIYNRGV